MSAITEMAERLGKTISESPQAAALRQARTNLEARPDITQLLNDFQEHSDKLGRLQAENKPVEVEDKHKLTEFQDKLIGEEVFKKYTAAQMEYVDLMRQVNEALSKHLGATEGQ